MSISNRSAAGFIALTAWSLLCVAPARAQICVAGICVPPLPVERVCVLNLCFDPNRGELCGPDGCVPLTFTLRITDRAGTSSEQRLLIGPPHLVTVNDAPFTVTATIDDIARDLVNLAMFRRPESLRFTVQRMDAAIACNKDPFQMTVTIDVADRPSFGFRTPLGLDLLNASALLPNDGDAEKRVVLTVGRACSASEPPPPLLNTNPTFKLFFRDPSYNVTAGILYPPPQVLTLGYTATATPGTTIHLTQQQEAGSPAENAVVLLTVFDVTRTVFGTFPLVVRVDLPPEVTVDLTRPGPNHTRVRFETPRGAATDLMAFVPRKDEIPLMVALTNLPIEATADAVVSGAAHVQIDYRATTAGARDTGATVWGGLYFPVLLPPLGIILPTFVAVVPALPTEMHLTVTSERDPVDPTRTAKYDVTFHANRTPLFSDLEVLPGNLFSFLEPVGVEEAIKLTNLQLPDGARACVSLDGSCLGSFPGGRQPAFALRFDGNPAIVLERAERIKDGKRTVDLDGLQLPPGFEVCASLGNGSCLPPTVVTQGEPTVVARFGASSEPMLNKVELTDESNSLLENLLVPSQFFACFSDARGCLPSGTPTPDNATPQFGFLFAGDEPVELERLLHTKSNERYEVRDVSVQRALVHADFENENYAALDTGPTALHARASIDPGNFPVRAELHARFVNRTIDLGDDLPVVIDTSGECIGDPSRVCNFHGENRFFCLDLPDIPLVESWLESLIEGTVCPARP